MKRIFALFALPLSTLISQAYVFTGGTLDSSELSGDLSDAGNYYSFTEDRISWIYSPMVCSGTATQQTTVPGGYEWVGFGEYTYGGKSYMSPTELKIERSFVKYHQTVFVYNTANTVVNVKFGSADTTDKSFTYQTASLNVKLGDTVTINFVRDTSAVQENFKVIMTNAPKFSKGTTNFGSVSTGALDEINSTTGFTIAGGVFNAYVKKWTVAQNMSISGK